MKAIFTYNPPAIPDMLYGDTPRITLKLHAYKDPVVIVSGENDAVFITVKDYYMLQAMTHGTPGAFGAPTSIKGLFYTVVDNDETSPIDIGDLWCDGCGHGNQEFLKGKAADLPVVEGMAEYMDPGSTFIAIDQGKLYNLTASKEWQLMS